MAEIQYSMLSTPNFRSTDVSSSTDPSMSSQASDASLIGDAIAKPATTIDVTTSNDSTRMEYEKDALGTPHPDRIQQTQFEEEFIKLKAKLEELEKQANNDREIHKMMQKELYTKGPPIIGFPSIDAYDYWNDGDNYLKPWNRDRILKDMRPAKNAGLQHIDGRKKFVLGALEAELQWIKTEDKELTNLMAERDQLVAENGRLGMLLAKAEEKLRQNTIAEEKVEEAPEYEQVGVDSQEPARIVTDLNTQGDREAITPMALRQNKPQLNRVEWKMFVKPLGRAFDPDANPEDLFAIDVLEGDPVITFQYLGWRARQRLERMGPVTKKKQLPPGQGPIPERIRINSRYILKILEKIDPDKFAEEDEENQSLVMVRPYKALIYYEDQIQKKYQDLKKEFGSPAQKPEGNTATSEEIKNYEVTSEEKLLASGEENDPLTTSAVALEQLEVLVQFLDIDIKEKIAYVRSDQCQRISFTDIWYLFKLGDEVIDQGRKQAYRVIGISSSEHKVIPPWRNFDSLSAKSDETPVFLHCVYIDFDGKNLGPVLETFQIPRFEGEKLITSLVVYPLRIAEGRRTEEAQSETFRQKLIARGKMFTEVLSVKHMNYNGFTLETRDEVDGQVMIDFEESFASVGEDSKHDVWRPFIQSLIGVELHETKDTNCDAGCCTGERVLKDSYAEEKRNEDYINSLIPEERSLEPSVAIYPRALKDIKSPENALTDDDFVIMSYRVFGFILRSRKWAKLDLTYLQHVSSKKGGNGGQEKASKPRETAFDQLVMEKSHKKVILSLTAQHFRDKESAAAANEQVDIVRGKGKGLIILLHGAPGVGKTTTAEGVAELFERPLFQITCGDLGTTAESVEATLETNFSLANRWDCILLLDEADVFLAKRTPQDFKRNGLVSVFLRVLEYYAGILFLTTNRIGDFDEAFGSRIHLSLHYPQLELKATKEIFELNIRLIRQRFVDNHRKIEVEEDLILESAEKYWNTHKKMRWNGRQIRNACQTALALANFEAQGESHERIVNPDAVVKLTVKHLEVVSAAYLQFMVYLKKLYKTDQDRLAHKRGYRAREFDESKAPYGGGKAKKTTTELDSTSGDESDEAGEGVDPMRKDDGISMQSQVTPALTQLSSPFPTLASQPVLSGPPHLSSPSPAVAHLEAVTAATREQNPTLNAYGQAGGYMFQNPNPGYAHGYPAAYTTGNQPAVSAGGAYGPQLGGAPISQQQHAQMWSNMHPAMFQQAQQAMMQRQMPPFVQPQYSAQQPPHPGSYTDGSVPPNTRPA